MKRFYLKIKYDIVIMVKNMIEIHVNLNSMEDIFHPFSKNTLNPTLTSFIYEECFGYLAKNNIQIFISSNQSFTDKEKETIAKLIHSNFKAELEEEKVKNKLSNTFRTILFIVGILILIFVYFIQIEFVHEFLLILGWLAIWETVYDFLFMEMKEKNKRKRYQKISESKIIFE